VTTADGVVAGSAIEDALGVLDAVDVSVTYAVPEPAGYDLAVTAITLRSGRSVDATDLSMALGQLPPDRRPHVVHVVDRIPTSTSHRPLPNAFAQRGRPTPGPGVYEVDPLSGDYRATKRPNPPQSTPSEVVPGDRRVTIPT
jgi:putative long chain acyl-CoA synthase